MTSTPLESYVGWDYGSILIWRCSKAMYFSKAVDDDGCKEDEG
jgi:hypothetical protein